MENRTLEIGGVKIPVVVIEDVLPEGEFRFMDRRISSDESKGNGRRLYDINDVGGMLYCSEF